MTTPQRNSQTMSNSVVTNMNTYPSVWTASPSTTAAFQLHQDHLENISHWQFMQDEQDMIPGLVQNKALLRQKITFRLIAFSGSIRSWANANSKFDIVSRVTKALSRITRNNASSFSTNAMVIHSITLANQTALIPYGISVAANAELLLLINEYINNTGQVKAKKADVSMATEKLKLAVSAMLLNLKDNLDQCVKQFNGTPFFTAYFNSRKTYRLKRGSTALRGTVTNLQGTHIHNAEISIINSGLSRTDYTNRKGNFSMKDLDLDSCTIRVVAVGYLPAEYDITLKRSHTTDFDIIVMPVSIPVTNPVNTTELVN